MKYVYRIYQLCIAAPVIIVLTIITSLVVVIGTAVGFGHWAGYYPGKWWAWSILKVLLIPVKVTGREHLKQGQSYVFVSNHQGAFDIFLIYGHLCRNFKWMMKQSLRKIPFVGYACEKSHQIFVDKRGASKVKKTYDDARRILSGGISVTVFPEGARTFTGHMAAFRRGAFMLADELHLPVAPLTINGSFDILPRMKGLSFVTWHPLSLTIHEPIIPQGQGAENIRNMMDQSYEVIMSALVPEYQGYVENPDQ
ncbi:MAG: 1-acyl-sn-glycerol-3-phosphate acyltransferase [Prevotella sp.]|nr:1-acyl-sn-glycerol-3-phosphate acyltransferase [Prevotella sp.]